MISEIEQNVNLFKMQGIAGDEREYNWKKEMIQIQNRRQVLATLTIFSTSII